MKSKLITAMAILVIAYPYALTRASAATTARAAGSRNSSQTTGSFSADELDNLLSPIALYPDPLLAQILPAATFVDQIQQAAAWLKANNNPAGINNQPWDTSVKALAGFPDVLNKMNDHLDWTTAVGQAYVSQSTDVSASIQRLRQQAKNSGALTTTPQQTVGVDQGNVTIMPTQQNTVYVPQYNPDDVWGSTGAAVASGLLTFGTGLAIGAWRNNGWYNSWNWGGGGIRNINNNLVNVNRNIMNRSINAGNLNRFNGVHRNTDFGRHARTAPGRPGAGALPGRPGGVRPGTTGIGGNRPNTLNRAGTAGIGGNRPNASPGLRSSTPNRTSSMSRPSGGNRGAARAPSGGARRGGGGGRRH